MRLEQLLPFENIAIQTHDDPDADAIASSFGLYCFIRNAGRPVRLFYSGAKAIVKPNLQNLVRLLDMPLEYLSEPDCRQLRNSNLSLDDLALAAAALKDLHYDAEGRFALLTAPPCDPNMLGFISDLVIQADLVDAVAAFSQLDEARPRFSIRTDTRAMTAVDLARDLTAGGLGSGGGHVDKAGGSLNLARMNDLRVESNPRDYIRGRLINHHRSYRLIDCSRVESWRGADLADFQIYEKLPARLAFVPCTDLLSAKTGRLRIMMLEGDITIEADAETYLMIGLAGEVYPIKRNQFQSSYQETGERAELDYSLEASYPPMVIDPDNGRRFPLDQLARACLVRGGARVRARRLTEGVKVFTTWDNDNYLKGEVGDWLVQGAVPNDFYVVTAAIFPRLYQSKQ